MDRPAHARARHFRASFAHALEAEDATLGLTTAEALEPLWIRGMRQREAVRWLEPLLALESKVDPAVRAGALTLAGRSAIEMGEVTRAEPWLREGLELACRSGDLTRTAWALHGPGHFLAEQGDHNGAETQFEESRELFLELGDHAPAGGRMTFLAYYAIRDGDLDRAGSLLERATEHYRLAGDLSGVSGCIHALGDIALERGDVRSALGRYRESQAILIQGGSSLDVAHELAGSAAVAALLGRGEEAARIWGAFLRLETESERLMDADDRVRYERAVGEPDETEVAAGRELSAEEALQLARATADQLAD